MASDSAIHSLAGSLAGIIAITATYPLIFISTRAAVEVKSEDKSTFQAVVDILKREGIHGLYSGLSSSMLGVAVSNGIYYYFYERSKGVILKSRAGGKGLSTLESMLIGAIAGSATTIISNPIWVIQTAQAVRTMNSSDTTEPKQSIKKLNMIETLNHILRKDGIGAFWRGIGPALVLVINPIVQYTIFEQLKNFLVKRRLEKLRAANPGVAVAAAILSDWDYFFLGAFSKLIATSATYPYIVAKSRLQAGHKHGSSLECLFNIVENEGIGGLYKGIGSKLTQSVLTAAILFACQKKIYDMTKQALVTIAK
ncbi:mitochondrial carrier family protein [Abortiporus biennis]